MSAFCFALTSGPVSSAQDRVVAGRETVKALVFVSFWFEFLAYFSSEALFKLGARGSTSGFKGDWWETEFFWRVCGCLIGPGEEVSIVDDFISLWSKTGHFSESCTTLMQ